MPYLLGSNNDEGVLLVYTQPAPADDPADLDALKARFGDAADQVAAQYPASKLDGDYGAALARARSATQAWSAERTTPRAARSRRGCDAADEVPRAGRLIVHMP